MLIWLKMFCDIPFNVHYHLVHNANRRTNRSWDLHSCIWRPFWAKKIKHQAMLTQTSGTETKCLDFYKKSERKRQFITLPVKYHRQRSLRKITGDAGDRTRGLSHAKRTLYRWATSPVNNQTVFHDDKKHEVFEKSLYPYPDRSVASGSISPRDNTQSSVMVAWPSGLRRWF